MIRWPEDLDVAWTNLLCRSNLVVVNAPGCGENDFIVFANVSESAEKRIAMAGYDDIPISPRELGGWDLGTGSYR